ncbi:MAG: DUF5654 family protein [Methanobrevibacter sp.]|uniref:DUF5654 family protein n=1 Tax=Methanobrevibacter sp. TaxID=66852 RepID=UPI0026DF0C4C|nr:DUF5654 family protein [Methanobrevibacter sp.]MDO5849451.1 DUF5654 family protein [Methanobrevibacter sp.]
MAESVHKEMLKTMSVLMTTAFAFVAGAAWNGAIQAIIEQFLPAGDAVWSLLIYAIIVTIIAVIATLIIGRLIAKAGIEIDE